MTDGGVRMGPGTLYGTIQRMLAAGLLEETDAPPEPVEPGAKGPERRRYYRATPLGRDVLEAETARMSSLVSAARAKRVRAR